MRRLTAWSFRSDAGSVTALTRAKLAGRRRLRRECGFAAFSQSRFVERPILSLPFMPTALESLQQSVAL
jgi:hypothetical protein